MPGPDERGYGQRGGEGSRGLGGHQRAGRERIEFQRSLADNRDHVEIGEAEDIHHHGQQDRAQHYRRVRQIGEGVADIGEDASAGGRCGRPPVGGEKQQQRAAAETDHACQIGA